MLKKEKILIFAFVTSLTIAILLYFNRKKVIELKNEAMNYLDTIFTDAWNTKRVVDLHPKIKPSVNELIDRAEKELGVSLRITRDGHFRSFEEQNDLYAIGRTVSGKKVTSAKGGQSFHNYGLAVDLVEIKGGKAIWNNPKQTEIKDLAESIGFKWGGSWGDRPHYQMTFGNSWQDLLAKKESGQVGSNGYVKI